MLSDDETWSRWDHITGACFEGELKGRQLHAWSIQVTNVAALREEKPDCRLLSSGYRSVASWFVDKVGRRVIDSKGFIPPTFKHTMSAPVDPRLDRLTQGLGVIINKEARFYPMSKIPKGGFEDHWEGRALHIERGAIDRVPRGRWVDEMGEAPLQLLTRWYGFSFTYPGCKIVLAP